MRGGPLNRLLLKSLPLLIPLPFLNGQSSLIFDKTSLDNGSVITFDFDYVDTSGPDPQSQHSTQSASVGDVSLLCDMSTTSFTGITYYTFDTYLHFHAQDVWQHFKAKAQANGPFVDTQKSISFSASYNGSQSTKGTITIPIYNPVFDNVGESIFTPKSEKAVHAVHLVLTEPIRIKTRNPSDQLPIKLLDVHAAPQHIEYWKSVEASFSKGYVTPNSSSETVTVTVTPKLLPALIASFVGHAAAEGDEYITLEGTYQSLPGGPVRRIQPLTLQVNFVPSGSTLFGALVLGVVAALVALAILQKTEFGLLLKGFVAAAILSIIVEFVGIGLVQAHSTFQLFGVSLDPATAQGAFLVGTAGGIVCLRKSSQLLKWLDEKFTFTGQHLLPLLVAIGLTTGLCLNAQNVPFQPIGIIGTNGSELFSASKDGEVFTLNPTEDRFQTTRFCQVPSRGRIIDITRMNFRGEDVVVTLQIVPLTGVTKYIGCTTGGRVVQILLLRGAFAGVAWDPVGSTLWVANSITREISRFANGKTSSFCEISQAATINSLAFDSTKRILYAGDGVHGDLFAVEVTSRRVRKIADGLGDIRAVTVDGSRS